MATTSALTVSLEPHLSDILQSIKECLPDDLREGLMQELARTEIHYDLLLRISQWARTEAGTRALSSLHIQASDLLIVNLLAGTRTSPSSKLPPYNPPEPDEIRMQRERNERRAIAFVINGFLSVLCAGGSAWWAANKVGWKPEWAVLLALAVGSVVGLSETVLFIIWQNRTIKSPKSRGKYKQLTDKKHEDSEENVDMSTDEQSNNENLRRRKVALKD